MVQKRESFKQTRGKERRGRFDSEAQKEFEATRKQKAMEDWVPKTETGRKVKNGEIGSLEQLFDLGYSIMEPEIVDFLSPGLEEEMVEFAKTTRVVRSGRIFSFRASVLVGNKNGFVGIGSSKDKEKMSAIKKAANDAKLNIVRVHRGCGSWECTCGMQHSVPLKVEGKCASVRIKLRPAPKGVGLVVGENIKNVFRFAGITDVWAESRGSTGTKLNFIKAAVNTLAETSKLKISDQIKKKLEKVM